MSILSRSNAPLATNLMDIVCGNEHGFNFTTAGIGGTLSAAGLCWIVYSGSSVSWMCSGVLLLIIGISLCVLATYQVPKLEKHSAVEEVCCSPNKKPIILECIKTSLLNYRKDAFEKILLISDNYLLSNLDYARLKEPVFNVTQKLYIEMFYEVLREIERGSSLTSFAEKVKIVESVSRCVRVILCKYMHDIDLYHNADVAFAGFDETYDIKMISYNRIEDAFNILMDCDVGGSTDEDMFHNTDAEFRNLLTILQEYKDIY